MTAVARSAPMAVIWLLAFAGQLQSGPTAPIGLEAPEWVLVMFAGVALAFWILDKLGRLPTPSKKEEKDAASLLLSYRGEDGVERYLKHVRWSRETLELLRALSSQQARVVDLLERVESRGAVCQVIQEHLTKEVNDG